LGLLNQALALLNSHRLNQTLRPSAFDRNDFIFDLKMDGFRVLVVRKSFPDLAAAVHIDLDFPR
jgi:hypothetical protein